MTEKFALSPEQAWDAFEAQLRYTKEVIDQSLRRGYQDDQGDYLFAALELSRDLQLVAMDGDDASLVDKFFNLAAIDNTQPQFGPTTILYANYATDGIAKEVVTIIEKISGIEF
jgi:hypothetical protein